MAFRSGNKQFCCPTINGFNIINNNNQRNAEIFSSSANNDNNTINNSAIIDLLNWMNTQIPECVINNRSNIEHILAGQLPNNSTVGASNAMPQQLQFTSETNQQPHNSGIGMTRFHWPAFGSQHCVDQTEDERKKLYECLSTLLDKAELAKKLQKQLDGANEQIRRANAQIGKFSGRKVENKMTQTDSAITKDFESQTESPQKVNAEMGTDCTMEMYNGELDRAQNERIKCELQLEVQLKEKSNLQKQLEMMEGNVKELKKNLSIERTNAKTQKNQMAKMHKISLDNERRISQRVKKELKEAKIEIKNNRKMGRKSAKTANHRQINLKQFLNERKERFESELIRQKCAELEKEKEQANEKLISLIKEHESLKNIHNKTLEAYLMIVQQRANMDQMIVNPMKARSANGFTRKKGAEKAARKQKMPKVPKRKREKKNANEESTDQ